MNQLSAEGIKINEGKAIDARIVKSASKPLNNKKLDKLKAERSALGGQLDKIGNPRKFSGDIESDLTIKNDKPYYGLKEHTSIDTNHGFILATVLSPASVHDPNYFQYRTLIQPLYEAEIENGLCR